MDIQRVLVGLGKNKPEQTKAIYKRVFQGEDGLYVLLDILVTTGRIGMQRSPKMTPHEAIYANGVNDTVLKIATAAGVDPYKIALYLSALDEAKRAEKARQSNPETHDEGIDHEDDIQPNPALEPGGWRDGNDDFGGGDPEPISAGAAELREHFPE